MKVVSPFRPFAPESDEHVALDAFDWIGALRMLAASVAATCDGAPTFAIGDADSPLPVPAYYYRTARRRLMLWILEVSLAYIGSDDFDDDTVMISPDLLVLDDLRRWWMPAALGVVLRLDEKFRAVSPLLNSVQFWRRRNKSQLADFYGAVLERAEALPERSIRWGADTEPLVELLEPLSLGFTYRRGLKVYGYDGSMILSALKGSDIRRLEAGRPPKARLEPILDFRSLRKRYMAAYFASAFQEAIAG